VLPEAEANHTSWFGRGRDRIELEAVSVFLGGGDAVLAFPGPDADLGEAIRLAREAGVHEIGCWALAPDVALGERLRGLGFQDGWRPHWMGIDPRAPHDSPAHRIEHTAECDRELPYWSEHHEIVLGPDVHHFIARDGPHAFGHVVLNICGNSAGIYDMGVAPGVRRQGYGRALTLAALACARSQGCTSVTLNATYEGEPLYRSVGFRSFGFGMTWWLFPRRR
jgi:GNAT superfamily N-acetyltransferase